MRIIFQLVIAFLAFSALVSVARKKRENLLGPLGAFFWVVFWLALVSIVSAPMIAQWFADMIGIGRGVDLVMYVSIAVLFFVVFKLHIKIEGLKRDMTVVVRNQALQSEEKGRTSS